MKRFLATLLTVALMVSTVVTGVVPAQAAETDDAASKYVTLDGEWHYKLYRKYSQMFQYFAFMPALAAGNLLDAEAAAYPEDGSWTDWDVLDMPSDDATYGGLHANSVFPTWSESWVIREFDLPEDFTEDEYVTLMMGIIDDNDVIYINGTPVAASGFIDGNGEPTLNIPELGGFNYGAEAAEDQVKWQTSYWEVQREYQIPASVLNEGETNVIAVRLFNNNSNCGFYSGQIYALCGNESAVRELKGLPSEKVESDEVIATVAAQNDALAAGDIDAYAGTISDNYHNDADDKDAKVAEAEALMAAYSDITVTDENAAVYLDDEDGYWYVADRTITGVNNETGEEETISSGAVETCFEVSRREALERGNWNRCYGASYDSELFGQELTYSVYLPPSYFENTDQEYPVVWLLHGQNSSSTSYRDVDGIGAFMDELIEDEEIVEMVLIMPDSGKNAFYRDSEIPEDGNINEGGPWRTQLTEELRAEAQANYRIMTEAEFNGLTGNSMGGYGSLNTGTLNPDLYSSIGLHMGYLPNDALNNLKALSMEELEAFDFYMDAGLQDQTVGYRGTVAVHEYLESVGKEHGYSLRDGAHNSAFYMSGMANSMKMHSDHFVKNGLYEDDPSMYVTLEGDWNYKLYRTYANMFQYFAFVPSMAAGKWTDAEAALLPDADTWKDWDVLQMPADDPETGGLLSNELSPTWSEAWVVREFDLPIDFANSEEVTLLMGIVDDNDVIYINGQPVAASGFVDGNGNPTLNIPAAGGFNYTAEAKEDQVKWEKSYWEIQREYTIPADVLNLGGTNEIAIRLYNNNSFGGFYSGNIYALCGNELAVRDLKGLPTEVAESDAVDNVVADQIDALEAGDAKAYAATIASDYHNDAADKGDKIDEVEAMIAAYSDITVDDANAATYIDDEGNYWYSAERTITGTNNETGVVETISSQVIEQCYEVSRRTALERGNWNRCYGTSYASELFGEDLTYSVYLPPNYYEKTSYKYPVVWLLHGRASSSTSYRDVDDIGAFMDNLIESGDVTDMVVIMPDSGKYAFYQDSELTPGDKDNSGPWATQLTEELRAVVEENYRVLTDAKFNGLTGNSMGGGGSMIIGTNNPDLYSSVAVHMGWLPQAALDGLASLTEEQMAGYDFYLDCGLQDDTVGTSGTIAVHEYLESIGKDHGYDLRDGGHNSAFYMSGMDDSMIMHSEHFLDNGALKAGRPSSSGGGSGSSSKDDTVVEEPIVTPEPTPAPAESFSDLVATAWYNDAVNFALTEGIMSGVSDKQFAPAANVTRGTIVQILWAMEGKPVVNYAMSFQDVDADAWYAEAVRWAASEGVVSGYSAEAFGPNDNVTREQMAVILNSYARYKGYDMDASADVSGYADADAISGWAAGAMQWACAEGILSGKAGNLLDPSGTATRAEAAQMLMKFDSAVAE